MRRFLLAAWAVLALGGPAAAQRVGPLDARNNLGEIAASGATAQAQARTNLGLGSIATQSAGAVAVTGGAVSGADLSGGNVTATGGATARKPADRAADFGFNVRDGFNGVPGAKGDGVTDDRPAINAAIAAASAAGGGTVYLPPGTYRSNDSAGTILVKSHVTLQGAGRGRSTILIDDTKGGGNGISNNSVALSDFHLRGLTVSGMRATIVASGAQMIALSNGDNLSVEDCEITQSRNMGMVINSSKHVQILNNRVYHTNADGIAAWDDSDLMISGNEIEGANDDAISAHSNDGTAAPVRSGITITNNLITESQGISVGGAKNVLIARNILRRVMTYGIDVWSELGGTFPQGDTTAFGVKIKDNLISDVFIRNEPNYRNHSNDYLVVSSGPKLAGPLSAPPGVPTPGTGTVSPLYGPDGIGYFYTQGAEPGADVPSPGSYWIEVTGNQLVRTLPAVSAYSNWGFGTALFVGNNGDATGTYNGPISESALEPTDGIKLRGTFRNSRIAGNVIQTTGGYGINFDQAYSWQAGDLDGLVIEDNKIVDFATSGIWLNVYGTAQRVVFRDNLIDGDPRFVAPNRGPNGTWVTMNGGGDIPAATYNNATGAVWIGNSVRNVSDGNLISAQYHNGFARGNIVYAQPFAVGGSTSNKGVGNLPADGPEYSYVIEDSDPTSSTYGTMLSTTLLSASAMPSSGTYVAGHIVYNSAPTVSGPRGWVRLTTGSNHVLGTDWMAIYANGGGATGTAAITGGTIENTAIGGATPASVIASVLGVKATAAPAVLNFWNNGTLTWYLENNAGAGNHLLMWDQAGGRSVLDVTPGGAVKLSSAGTPVIVNGALIDSSGAAAPVVLTTAGYTVPANVSRQRFKPAATLASATLTLTAPATDNFRLQLVNIGAAVTAHSFSPAVNGWTNGSTWASNTTITLGWDATTSAWYREQ